MKLVASQLATWLNASAKDEIQKIPGFTAASIAPNADRLAALRIMDQDKLAFLPVVRNGKFSGVLDRSRLVTGVLVDVAEHLGISSQASTK